MDQPDYKVSFKQKPVSAIQTLGEWLSSAREERGFEVDEVAIHLQISSLYLEALEQGNYAHLPSAIYTRNFVKKYGAFLGLDQRALVKLFHQEWTLFEKHQLRLLDEPEERGVKATHLWKMPNWVRWMGAMMIILGVVSYLGYELYSLRQAPALVIETPTEELMLDKQIVEIAGLTDPEAELFINEQVILSDQEGNFVETVALQPGLNIIEITAKKKYSRENTQFRKILVESPSSFTSNDDSPEPPVS